MNGGMAGLFQVLYGKKDGTFKAAQVLNGTDGEPLIIPIADKSQQTENICTRPTAVDWDSDGDLDLVVGNFAGTFYWFAGEGNGEFQPKPEKITVNGEPLRIQGVHSDPFVIDWDQDGDLDIMSGSSQGGVYWAENVAGKGNAPKLKGFTTLIKPAENTAYGSAMSEDDIQGPMSSTRVFVVDTNDDGKLDIFVGDNVTLVGPAPGLSDEEFKAKHGKWQEELNAVLKELQNPKADAKTRSEASRRYSELYGAKSKILTEQRTGYVWLYVQK